MRIAGMGGIIGFDYPALIQIADRLGYDTDAVVELLYFCEGPMMEKLNQKNDHP